jgi:triosephosphate isomerase
MVRRKVELVMRTLITPVLCVGETRAEQKAGKRDSVLTRQLKAALSGIKPKPSEKIIVAYEPVWAIGTGLVSDPTEAEDAHEHIRRVAAGILGPKWSRLNLSVIYGGSVDSKNVRGFVAKPGIDGVLVGGASLKAVEFSRIANSFAHQTEIRRLAVGGELPA